MEQALRNALQAFHGCWAFDPDNPGSPELEDAFQRYVSDPDVNR